VRCFGRWNVILALSLDDSSFVGRSKFGGEIIIQVVCIQYTFFHTCTLQCLSQVPKLSTSRSSRCKKHGLFLGTRSRSSTALLPRLLPPSAMVRAQETEATSSNDFTASPRNEVMEQQLFVAKTLLQQAVDLLDNRLSSDEQLTVHSKYMPGSSIGQLTFFASCISF